MQAVVGNTNIDVFNGGDFTNRPATTPPYTEHGPGVSVRRSIEIALDSPDLTAVQGVQVLTANGQSVDVFTKDDLEDPAAFPADNNDPTPTPMFYTQSDTIVYGRPLRDDPNDTNTRQNTTVDSNAGNAPIVVKVHIADRSALQPVVTARPRQVDLGGSMRFTISYADDHRPDGTPRYYWSFGDSTAVDDCDTTAPSQSVAMTHTYRSPGTDYEVRVLVCGVSSSGESAPISVTVKARTPEKPPPPGPGTPHGKQTKRGPDNGPDDSDGNDANGVPSSARGTGGDAASTRSGTSGNQNAQQEAANGKKDAVVASAGESVTGILLDADAARSVTIRAPEAAPIAAAAARRGSPLAPDWRWLLGLVPLALLLGGVARQTPWLAARLPRPPWRDV